jgi:hypothetical protein
VVASYIIKGGFKGIDQTGKVFRGKVAAGKNQVNIRKRAGSGMLEKTRLNHV